MIITTKKGSGKLSINYNSSLQLEQVAYLPKVQSEFGVGGFPDGTLYSIGKRKLGTSF